MGNVYLIQEETLTDIADAIREKTNNTNLIATSEMAEAITNISSGTSNYKTYEGEIVSTVAGSSNSIYAILASDSFLTEHKDDEKLFVRVTFDIASTPYTIVSTWAFNDNASYPFSGNIRQYMNRYGSDGVKSVNTGSASLNATNPATVGCLQVTTNGELRIYPLSNNYAIRPSKYLVEVQW